MCNWAAEQPGLNDSRIVNEYRKLVAEFNKLRYVVITATERAAAAEANATARFEDIAVLNLKVEQL